MERPSWRSYEKCNNVDSRSCTGGKNVSVPTVAASRVDIFESDHTDATGKLVQFFIEDPDGYWLEICNCGADEEGAHGAILPKPRLSASATLKFVFRAARWAHRAKTLLKARRRGGFAAELNRLNTLPDCKNVDEQKLSNLVRRRNTYGDVCQGFSEMELRAALVGARNDVPGALLILEEAFTKTGGQIYCPPSFLDDSKIIHYTHAFQIP